MFSGFVKVDRNIRETSVWCDSDKLKLWLYCLTEANYMDKTLLFDNQKIDLRKGQFITGRSKLEDEFNKEVDKNKKVSGRTLYRWLELFEKLEMLSIEKTNKYSIITVLNWNKYQADFQQASNKCPTNVQQVSNSCPHKKKVKKVKKVKNSNNILSSSEEHDEMPKIPYEEIVEYLNEKANTKYKHSTKSTRDKIHARWNDGFQLDDFKKVIDTKTTEWKDTDMSKYLRPETLFGNKFESYLNQNGIVGINQSNNQDWRNEYE